MQPRRAALMKALNNETFSEWCIRWRRIDRVLSLYSESCVLVCLPMLMAECR
jgi:hypothetical protein